MNEVQMALGFERSPFVSLADFLTAYPTWAERCRRRGWFTETLEGGSMPGFPAQPRLPWQPLEDVLLRDGFKLSHRISATSVHRYRTEGIPLDRADDLATTYGYHPRDIWSDWYEIEATA